MSDQEKFRKQHDKNDSQCLKAAAGGILLGLTIYFAGALSAGETMYSGKKHTSGDEFALGTGFILVVASATAGVVHLPGALRHRKNNTPAPK